MEKPGVPDPDLVYGGYTGIYKGQLVRIALLLDVFSPLAAGRADAETVAKACRCYPVGMRALLNYLTSIKLLEREGTTYALTPTAATFLVRGRTTYAGDNVLGETSPETWEARLTAFRTGQPCHLEEFWPQDAWLESYSSWRPAKSREMWKAAGIEAGKRPRCCAISALVCVFVRIRGRQSFPTASQPDLAGGTLDKI